MIELANRFLSIRISSTDGTIQSILDRTTGVEYVSPADQADPFRLERDSGMSSAFRTFSGSVVTGSEAKQEAALVWETECGVSVTAAVTVHGDRRGIEFRCSARNETEERILSLEYPIIPGLTAITDGGARDYVAHSFATGFKVRNPMVNFTPDGPGLRFMPYPESFSGASMQFFSYYGEGRGGLYFAALDGEGYAKWLNFYKHGGGWLEASVIHGCEDMGPGKGIQVPYPVIVEPLAGGDWYEGADLYKSWAKHQIWCKGGTLADCEHVNEELKWLHESMGAATFGINAGSDRTAWLRKYHEYIQTPMFHILGPDWTHAPQTFYKGVPGGMDDWFPTRFNRSNIDGMKLYGDKFAPFEFDYLYHFDGADGEKGREAAQKFPADKKSIDAYNFPFICPAHPYTSQFHVDRDARLQQSDDVDAIYYDISANNILKICMDDTHGHPVGAGRRIAQAYRDIYVRTKAAMSEAAGRYVPMGTEMMNELYLDVLDYYQARAGGQPAAPLEGWPLRDLLKSGEAELIPMFAYVYHEYGALRLDGWGKLVEEIGQLYYFTVARTYLWGGLYELNYEYSPMEQLEDEFGDNRENSPEEHYYPFEPRGYSFSAERARYLGMYAALRTGAGSKYLAYGSMLRPLKFECGKVSMDWFHYNHGKETKEYNDSGVLEVDSVVHAAWGYKNESAALFFANVTDQVQDVVIKLNAVSLNIPELSEGILYRFLPDQQNTSTVERMSISGLMHEECPLQLAPRSVVMLELK